VGAVLQAVGGNTALALLLVIATNLGGIFTMPVRALSAPSGPALRNTLPPCTRLQTSSACMQQALQAEQVAEACAPHPERCYCRAGAASKVMRTANCTFVIPLFFTDHTLGPLAVHAGGAAAGQRHGHCAVAAAAAARAAADHPGAAARRRLHPRLRPRYAFLDGFGKYSHCVVSQASTRVLLLVDVSIRAFVPGIQSHICTVSAIPDSLRPSCDA
jgi:hypothetical protein